MNSPLRFGADDEERRKNPSGKNNKIESYRRCRAEHGGDARAAIRALLEQISYLELARNRASDPTQQLGARISFHFDQL
ncbi:hypothetical protein [Methylovirgula ligni]|uniref:hypothetical protein n=1 Tax=Methylovirgula ligni TaxID=569860 RepID=UPI0010104555|nr:hypothetical protein [Methylovirgula ligni]